MLSIASQLLRYQRTSVAAIAVGFLVMSLSAVADDKTQKKVTFEDDVVPIFRAKCGTCHNGSDRRGGLVLDDYATMMEGGASGDAVFGGDLESSYLWLLVTHDSEPVMPPNAPKLPQEELDIIKAWIEQGILRDAGSKAKKSAPNPALAKVTVTLDRPEGPPPMPLTYLGEPPHVTSRPNSVTGLAVNPWSSLAAVAGHELVTLVDLNTMVPFGTLPYPEGTPQQIGFSQNGQLLYVAGGRGGQSGKVVLYNVATGERIAAIGNEYDSVITADLSPDQSLVALGTPKKLIRTYESATGELVYENDKHTDWVTATAFSPDGVLLASADRSGGLVVWEAETGREFHVLNGSKESINAMAWRGDSNVLATAGDDDQVYLWEMNEGKEIKKFNGGVGDITDLEYTRDGMLLVTGRNDVAKLFDASGKQKAEFKGLSDDGMRVAYDHEGKRVLAGDWTGHVLVWSADGKQLGRIATNEPGAALQLSTVRETIKNHSAEREKQAAALAKLKSQLAERIKAADNAKAELAKATQAKAVVAKQVVERDRLVKEAESMVGAAGKALAAAEASLKTAEASIVTVKTLVDQASKTRDEAHKSVEAAGDDAALVETAKKALAAAEETVVKAKEQLSENEKAKTAATNNVKTAQASVAAANAELDKRQAARQQLNEKVVAADKQLAAWTETSKKAEAAREASKEEKALIDGYTKKISELDGLLKPLVARRDNLQKILALGK